MSNLPIIVGGFYRSGTTLVRRLLDSHSRIHCGPEVKFLKDFFGDYRDDPLAHVRLFATARSFGLPEPRLFGIFGHAFVEFHRAAAHQRGKARWADKNPENVLYLPQWQALLPGGFVFVHVVRDPFDALASLVEIGFNKTVPTDFESKVELLRKFRDVGAHYCRVNPLTSIEISYESLATEPETTVRGLMHKLGESFESEMLTNLNAKTRGSGIEDPKAALHENVHAGSVGRGHNELTQAEQQTIAQRLGDYIPVRDRLF